MVEMADAPPSDEMQCSKCGRVREDWSENRNQIKGRQRSDTEDRLLEYRRWRFTWGGGTFVSDIDQLEWRIVDGQVQPKAILELTRLDGDREPPILYFNNILKRFNQRDGQALAVKTFAKKLNISAAIVLYRYNLEEFWVFNLSNDDMRWYHMTKVKYRAWVERLR